MDQQTTIPKLLLNSREAADALSIGERKLWTMPKTGEIPSIRMGRSVRYDIEALRDWICQQSA